MPQVRSSRLQVLDLLRGFLLSVVVIDHLFRFPNLFEFITGRGQLWVSAAEGFFIISGLLVGLVHRVRAGHPLAVAAKTWSRALQLYLCSVVLSLLFTLWGWHLPASTVKFGLWTGGSWTRLIGLTLSLHYSYGWADFLPYYAVFLLAAPVVLYFLSRRRSWVPLVISLGLWAVRGQNFYLAWQPLFVTGIVAGFYLPQIRSWYSDMSVRHSRLLASLLFTITIITLALSTYFTFISPRLLTWFDKNTLGPGRLVLSWVWFLASVVLFSRLRLPGIISGFFSRLGKNSLLSYIFQAIIVFPLGALLPYDSGWLINTATTVTALFLMFAGVSSVLRFQAWWLQHLHPKHFIAPISVAFLNPAKKLNFISSPVIE